MSKSTFRSSTSFSAKAGRSISSPRSIQDDPFKRVVGWRDDLPKADPESYDAYLAKYPDIAKLPTFGGMKDGTFDVEQAVALKPDVIIMNIDAKTATEEAGYIEKLGKVGIPLVYVDFREKPMENTEPSMRIMGKLFGKEDKAEEFIKFRADSIARVTDVLAKDNPKKPLVFVERAGGYSDDCCMSFGNENFGKMVEIAGGINMAKDIIPGTFGTVNPEQIIASNPDQIIVTGGNWQGYVPGGDWVGVGYGADQKEALPQAGEPDEASCLHRRQGGQGRQCPRHLAPVLQQPLPVRRDPGDRQVAAPGAVQGSRSRERRSRNCMSASCRFPTSPAISSRCGANEG